MFTAWLLPPAAKLLGVTSNSFGNDASARGVAWQPSHVDPPSSVIVVTISTPAGASAGFSPPGHLTPAGNVTRCAPPFVRNSVRVLATPAGQVVAKLNEMSPATVAVTTLPVAVEIATLPDTSPSDWTASP